MAGPRVATISQADLTGGARLDAAYYQDEFILASLRVTHSVLETTPLAGDGGLVEAWIPSRTSLVLTASAEHGTPYLRAHDALERIPPFERYAALSQMKDGDKLALEAGWIVLTCSGRNFGPCAWVGTRLAQAAMTDIMRLRPRTEDDGLYALAFLNTPTGKTLIRRDPAGSVINHLAPADLSAIPVPLIPDDARRRVVEDMRKAVALCDSASEALLEVQSELRELLGLGDPAPTTWAGGDAKPRVSTRVATELGSRIDAEFFSSRHAAAVERIGAGGHDRLDAAAELVILGRYKRYYTEPPHGTPILSGGQLHQFQPVALKNIGDRSFKEPEAYRLKRGWSVIACDGRSEGDLGRPGYVSSLWEGWMASNHLMRVVPKPGIHPGYLHAALMVQETQVQLKSVATGSVVDALDDTTAAGVLIPRAGQAEDDLGTRVDAAYEEWAQAHRLIERAAAAFEEEVRLAYEAHDPAAAVAA
jgi:hypothetical protein